MALNAGRINIETEEPNLPIKSIYVPPFGLQGQDFSCHVTWSTEFKLEYVKISLENGLSFKNIYNVEVEGLDSSNEREIVVRQVIDNGYLGYILESDRLEVGSKQVKVELELSFEKDGKSSHFSKAFLLDIFRPKVMLGETPKEIKVSYPKGALVPEVSGKIRLKNLGPGLALVIVTPREASNVKLSYFFNAEATQFMSKLGSKLDEFRTDYPEHDSTISLIFDIFRAAYALEQGKTIDLEDFKKKAQELEIELAKIEVNDQEFLEEIFEEMSVVFRSVYTSSAIFQSMSGSLESMKQHRILLLNTMSAVEVEGKESKIGFNFLYLDTMGYSYPEFSTGEISLFVEGDPGSRIPMFQLIDAVGD